MTMIRTWLPQSLSSSKVNRAAAVLLLLIFAIAPFQRRFHGALDSLSRKLTLPDIPLPEYFSKKIHLFSSDLAILALTVLVLFAYKIRLREFFFKGPSKYLTLLFFAGVVSLFFSITSHYALQYLRLFQFSTMFLLFNAVRCLQSQIDFVQLIKKLAWTLVAVSCVECALGIYQYFYQHSLGLEFLGEANVRHFPFVNPGKHRWFFDRFSSSSITAEYLCRSAGTLSHPNILGGVIFCSLMSSYFLWMKEESRRWRLFLIGAILLQIFVLYTAYSRSDMIALLVSTSLWFLLQIRQNRQMTISLKRFAGLLGVIAIVGIAVFYSQISARGGILNYNHVTQFADSERIQYLKMALEMIKDHPLLGVGFNNFQLVSEPIQAGFPGHVFFAKVHNIYLLLAAEMGLLGGGLFLLFLFAISKTAFKAIFSSAAKEGLQERIFLFSLFIGLLVIGLFDFYFINAQAGRILFFGFAALLFASASPVDEPIPVKLSVDF